MRTEQGRLAEAMPAIRRKLAESGNAILESNSILKFVRPDLYLTVLDPATADFKKSAQEFLGSGGRGHPARKRKADAGVARDLAEAGGGTAYVSHLSAGLRHACRSSNL